MRSGADLIVRAFPMARSLWQKDVRLPNGVHGFEVLSINGHVVLVQSYPGGNGWEVYVPVTQDGRIDVTLDALAKYCEVERGDGGL